MGGYTLRTQNCSVVASIKSSAIHLKTRQGRLKKAFNSKNNPCLNRNQGLWSVAPRVNPSQAAVRLTASSEGLISSRPKIQTTIWTKQLTIIASASSSTSNGDANKCSRNQTIIRTLINSYLRTANQNRLGQLMLLISLKLDRLITQVGYFRASFHRLQDREWHRIFQVKRSSHWDLASKSNFCVHLQDTQKSFRWTKLVSQLQITEEGAHVM